MTTTNFEEGTIITKEWLNDADEHIYDQVADLHESSRITFTPTGTGAVATTVQAKLRDIVSVMDFGAVGDGVTDDTTAIQTCFNTGKYIIFPAGYTFKISSALTYTGRGIYMEPGARIDVTGSGYTALTLYPAAQSHVGRYRLYLWGTGNTANGILMDNVQSTHFEHIRVHNLDGFGLKIQDMWDCTFDHVSITNCGNATHYAFSLNDGVDICNMSNFMHIQVELANRKAIYISPNTLYCVFQNIHSEQLTPNATDISWELGGNRCTYVNAKLNSNAPAANASCYLNAAICTYINLFAEDGIAVEINTWSASANTLITPVFNGTYEETGGATGIVSVYGGGIDNIPNGVTYTRFHGVNVEGTRVDLQTGKTSQAVSDNASVTKTCSVLQAGTYLVSVLATGTNMALSRSAVFSCADANTIGRITALDAGTDYNIGSITFQTYAATAVNSYSLGNGFKFDVICDNTPTGAGSVTFYISWARIG